MTIIDGIVSGLDTTGIINQLLAVERRPIEAINARIQAGDRRANALRGVQQSLDGLRTAAQALSRTSAFNSSKVTSSAPDRVSATAAVGTPATRIALRVLQLATAHQMASGASVGDATALTGTGRFAVARGLAGLGVTAIETDASAVAGIRDVRVEAAGAGQMRIAIGAESTTVAANATTASVAGVTLTLNGALTAGTGTLQVIVADGSTTVGSLVTSLNAAGSPASAQLVNFGNVAAPDRRLTLRSSESGEANGLLVSATDFGGAFATAFTTTTTIATARNARIEIGDGVVITRASNIVDDLYDGVMLTLKQADAAQTIALDVDKDVDDLAAKVKSWVDAVNATLASIDSQSAYDATTKVGGPLMGDPAVRTVRTQLMSALTTSASSGPLRVLSQIGLTIARNGRVQLDDAQLRKALTGQPDAVAGLLGRSATVTTANASFVSATEATAAGTYAIEVTTASAPAAITGTAFTALAVDETLTIRLGGSSMNVTLGAGTAVADAATALQNALASAQVNARVTVVAGALRVESRDHGSAAVLGISSSLGVGADATGLGVTAGLEQTANGVDVAGTIAGVAATGAGQLLTASSGPAKGLSVRIADGVVGAAGSVTFGPGVMGSVTALLGAGGSVTVAIGDSINSVNSKKTAYNDQIERMQLRLTRTERRLRRQFTQLESALAMLRSQGTRLNAIIGSTKNNTNNQSN